MSWASLGRMTLYPRPTVGQWHDVYLTDASVGCPDCGQPMVLIMLEFGSGDVLTKADWECRDCGSEVRELL